MPDIADMIDRQKRFFLHLLFVEKGVTIPSEAWVSHITTKILSTNSGLVRRWSIMFRMKGICHEYSLDMQTQFDPRT